MKSNKFNLSDLEILYDARNWCVVWWEYTSMCQFDMWLVSGKINYDREAFSTKFSIPKDSPMLAKQAYPLIQAAIDEVENATEVVGAGADP